MKPYHANSCAGHYADWLEVMLTPHCNGSCSWCVEADGYRPGVPATWREIAATALATGKKNIMLLGGEPTLYPDLGDLVQALVMKDRQVYLTTNGSKLTSKFIFDNLQGVAGVNISIHDYGLMRNAQVTGILLHKSLLAEVVEQLRIDSRVRFNCNLIQGHIDSGTRVCSYIAFAHEMGANCVRFAELRGDVERFVNVKDIFASDWLLSLPDDPFSEGCSVDTVINSMPVNIRMMCGIQTPLRAMPENPEQIINDVLYYDGQLYKGWQKREETMETMDWNETVFFIVCGIVQDAENGKVPVEQAARAIIKLLKDVDIAPPAPRPSSSGGGCRY